MIVETKQPITCGISMKSEILLDHTAPVRGRRVPAPRTGITHHLAMGPRVGRRGGAKWGSVRVVAGWGYSRFMALWGLW
jgi:hypothetical protein